MLRRDGVLTEMLDELIPKRTDRKRSRVVTGFNRLGIVLTVPLLLLAVSLGVKELIYPSGQMAVQIPHGSMAWKASDRISESDRTAIASMQAKQTAMGITVPEGFIFVGMPKEVEHKTDVDWTKFELWDGRVIGIASTTPKTVSDAAVYFLWSEQSRGQNYTDKDQIEFNGTKVTYLNPFDQFPPTKLPWPTARRHDWTMALLSAGAAVAIYLVCWSLGWIIDGFVRE